MNSIKFTLLGIVILFMSASTLAQNKFLDSAFRINKLNAGIEAGYYYYDPLGSKVVLLPDLLSVRRPIQSSTRYYWGLSQDPKHENLLSDNPLMHGAGYITLHLCDYVNKNFDILASMTGELRGTSYGVYNTGNTIVYPQLRLRYHDTVAVLNKKLAFSVSGGNYNNIRIDEGLIYYNVDAEAWCASVSYDGFTFEHMHIADLLYTVGLNIDDAWAQSLYYNTRKGRKGEIWKFGFGYDVNDIIYGFNKRFENYYQEYDGNKEFRNFYNLYAALIPDSSSRVYVQASNLVGAPVDESNTNAFLLGAKKEIKQKNFRIFCRAEIRYYGSFFKNNLTEDVVYYRNLTQGAVASIPANYGNSIGPNLYPLRNYERPFSQFASFTEEQFNPYSIAGASIYLDGDFRIYKQLFFKVNLDINYMTWFSPEAHLSQIPNSASFTYPFYKTGILFQPAKNTNVFIGITNKGMNLDNTYQTFYLLKDPYIYFEVTKTVKGFLER